MLIETATVQKLHTQQILFQFINISFAGCSFPFQSSAVHIGTTQLCCNFSSLAFFLPRVFISGTLQSITEHLHHNACDIVYLVPILQSYDGLEIAVSYGSSTLGRWNASIHLCKLSTIVFVVIGLWSELPLFSFTPAVPTLTTVTTLVGA